MQLAKGIPHLTEGNFYLLTVIIDGGSAVLRIHLSCHHVLSLLLLGPRAGTRNHPDHRSSCLCPLYFSDRLVNIPSQVAQTLR